MINRPDGVDLTRREYRLADELTWSAPTIVGKQLLLRHGEQLSSWTLP